MIQRPRNLYAGYHAHIYFGPETVTQARAVAEEAGRTLPVAVGRVHEKRVGPHPQWSCQLSFAGADFEAVIPWLEAHRHGLTVFVHGLTGDDLADHTTHASWLGEEAVLDLSQFMH